MFKRNGQQNPPTAVQAVERITSVLGAGVIWQWVVRRPRPRQRQHILAAWNYLASGNKEMAQAELAAALV